ncbi:MAG: hypothetical protein WD431_25500 [Cyclobacteriaceae bacterium]
MPHANLLCSAYLQRGRDFYEGIAQVLKMAADMPAIHHDVENLAKRIYSRYSRLTALRDELKTAGLVKL